MTFEFGLFTLFVDELSFEAPFFCAGFAGWWFDFICFELFVFSRFFFEFFEFLLDALFVLGEAGALTCALIHAFVFFFGVIALLAFLLFLLYYWLFWEFFLKGF